MNRSRGISEKIVYVYSPLPTVGEAPLLEAAGLAELFEPSVESPFRFTWTYGTGLVRESVDIFPGEFLPLRESEATEFMNSGNVGDLGLCVVPINNPDAPAVRKIAIKALQDAAKFYLEGGTKQLLQQKKRHSYSEAEMEDMRATYYAYHLNKAKEAAIRARIVELQQKPKPKAA